MGQEDRQPDQGRLGPEGLQRAAGAVQAAALAEVRRDRRHPHRRRLARSARAASGRHGQGSAEGRHRAALPRDHRGEYGQRAPRRAARLHRRGPSLLPQGPAGEVRRKAPTTWQDLTETAKIVQDGERKAVNDKIYGIVFQGRAYEGLTCNALEWVDSFGGGTIVDGQGKVTINNPKAIAAIKLAASWIKNIAPEGVLNYAEEEARGAFQSGNAVFMRNWPYAWALSQAPDSPVKGKVGVMALPKGGAEGKNTGTLGGWQWAVSKYSKNAKAAVDLAMYLTSPEEEKRAAIEVSFNPTIPALYKDKDILAKNPFIGELLSTFTNAVARPSRATKSKYNQVSSEFWNAVHEVLSGKSDAEASISKLEKNLNRISRNRKW